MRRDETTGAAAPASHSCPAASNGLISAVNCGSRIFSATSPQTARASRRVDGELQSQRRHLYDYTLSAPKSVSVVAALGEDDLVVQAHQQAVEAALQELEAPAVISLLAFGASGATGGEDLGEQSFGEIACRGETKTEHRPGAAGDANPPGPDRIERELRNMDRLQ
jgi:hypothetical protein